MATPITTPPNPSAEPRDFIVKTPGTCSGQPRIAGTRIKVKHVYVWVEQMGMTPTQVVAEYPLFDGDVGLPGGQLDGPDGQGLGAAGGLQRLELGPELELEVGELLQGL